MNDSWFGNFYIANKVRNNLFILVEISRWGCWVSAPDCDQGPSFSWTSIFHHGGDWSSRSWVLINLLHAGWFSLRTQTCRIPRPKSCYRWKLLHIRFFWSRVLLACYQCNLASNPGLFSWLFVGSIDHRQKYGISWKSGYISMNKSCFYNSGVLYP